MLETGAPSSLWSALGPCFIKPIGWALEVCHVAVLALMLYYTDGSQSLVPPSTSYVIEECITKESYMTSFASMGWSSAMLDFKRLFNLVVEKDKEDCLRTS